MSLYLLAKAERRFDYPHRVAYEPGVAAILSRFAEGMWNANLGPFAHGKPSPPPEARLLDEFLSRVLLGRVPAIVERALATKPWSPLRTPPDDVAVAAKEATRCFVFGFWNAAIVLSRATLEATLKTELRRFAPPPEKLSEVIDLARTRRVLDAPSQASAKAVRDSANRVLHQGAQADEKVALGVLGALRNVMAHVYGVAPPQSRKEEDA